jgi:hypothetical protein
MNYMERRGSAEAEHYKAEGEKLRELIKANYQADFKKISEKRFIDGVSDSVAEWDGHSWHTGNVGEESFDIDSHEAVDKFADILHTAGVSAIEYYSSLTILPKR